MRLPPRRFGLIMPHGPNKGREAQAHQEFLTSGTLLGQPPAHHGYVEVANLIKHGGAHFEGIVDPSQLPLLQQLRLLSFD